ncbi:MAG: methylated-DNA-[protein]-cysteine S-methyltransferase [Frankiales bacterium]|jgi:methylated-DNA-[protein]-cysteine S-methyltransferase|nr:methylated-DNA-[protein]-cysteine S-methyltransferase [Frankiales bacterium]
MHSPWVQADPALPTRWTQIASPVGELLLTRRGEALTGVTFAPFSAPALGTRNDDAFDDVTSQLEAYFTGERTDFDLPLAPRGTPFQLAVWAALLEIPYGQTCSYGQLAARIGLPHASRAVGAANGSNPLPIVVACHRVIGASGKLTGYGGGLDRKRLLLDLESAAPPLLRV